jgi:hypothetical protein
MKAFGSATPLLLHLSSPDECQSQNERPSQREFMKMATPRYKTLSAFFDAPDAFKAMYNIVQNRVPVSLRACEYLCTRLAKRDAIVTKDTNGEKVYLHAKYQQYLDAKGKSNFDVFRRNQQTVFAMHKHGYVLHSNIAQLEFFKFALTYGVIEYAAKHADTLRMLLYESRKRSRRQNTTNKRRRAFLYPHAVHGKRPMVAKE